MRNFEIAMGLGLVLSVVVGCQMHHEHEPTVDDIKSVRVLEQPDPRTLEIFGVVNAQRTIDAGELSQADELTLESLKAQAIRQFGDTTVLFNVVVTPGTGSLTFDGSAIAARRRGS